ncbi:MAG: SPFH domain-containing protein, partial [Planctomycetota bacterium]
FVFFGLVLGAMWVTGRLGFGKIRDDQVAVVVNYLSGDTEIVNTPGFKLYLPFVEEIFLLDKASQEFLMEGTSFVDANHVPRLTVRANDGSNFFFEKISILYQLIPGNADIVLTDSGPGDRFKNNWIKAHARSVLRDEFGRFSAVEAADPTQYEAAARRSKERLNELLSAHGLKVTRIVTPKPRFDPEYERAIEERKESDQEVERLIAKVEQLEQERGQRLSAVEKDKLIEKQGLEGDLIRAKREAEAVARKITLSADAYALKRRRSGEAEKAEKVAEARGLEVKYTKEAEGLKRQAEALEQRGEVIVREALIDKLSRIVFSFVPYSRDPSPKRLEHNDLRGADGRSLEQKSAEESGSER